MYITNSRLLACIYLGSALLTLQGQNLRQNFITPPQEARPRVWWHWMNGNITTDGLRKDLLWMDRVGIGGVHNFDANLSTPQVVNKRLDYMSDEWKKAYTMAVGLADSLQMEFTIASAPGWSATGGPWVENPNGMKKLTWRELQVKGSNKSKKPQQIQLPPLFTQTGVFQNYREISLAEQLGIAKTQENPHTYAEQIAVIAVKRAAADKSLNQLGAKITSSGGSGLTLEALTDGNLDNEALLNATDDGSMGWIQYEFPEPQTIKAISLMTGARRDEWTVSPAQPMTQLLASDDGQHYQCAAVIPQCFVPLCTIDIPETTAKFWRVEIENPEPDMRYAAYLNGMTPPTPKYTKVPEFRLYTTKRVNHAEEKAGFAAAWDMFKFNTPQCGTDEAVNIEQIIDITDLVDDNGLLTWNVPEGEWTILRFGWSLTGKENHPASPEATGLEVDKLDPIAFSDYLHTYLNMYREASKGQMGQRGIQYLLTDSYEAQQETWTPAMLSEFEQRRGYNLLPWLPALTGLIINSSEETERFLYDWRQTIGELIAENYDLITTIVQQDYGMKGRYTESHENGRLYIVDGMDVKRTAQIPMSALWCNGRVSGGNSTIMMAEADIRESASVAHIYGQNLVAAESMTVSGGQMTAYTYHPANLKQYVDKEFACGLNRVVIHTSAHQPTDTLRPGLGLMVFGQWFTRHETWAEQAKAWTDYIARSCYLLQQGRFVADVLYYYGEDNNVTGLFGDTGSADVPQGYAYDFCSPNALMHEVYDEDGLLKTHSGMQYRVLVLDQNAKQMSLNVLRKIAELARAGVTICGCMPERPSGRNDATAEWDLLVNEVWYRHRPNVTSDKALIDVLEQQGIKPDVEVAGGEYIKLPYVHRTLPEQEIYWIQNPTPMKLMAEVTFRTQGRKPQIWHPEIGLTEDASYRMTEDGRTCVTIPMVSEDALFVVFDRETTIPTFQQPQRQEQTICNIDSPWTVQFQPGQGAPAEAVTYPTLESLSLSNNPGIKYFSGIATYLNEITLSRRDLSNPESIYLLDLGRVANLAEVIVNGQNLGVVWKAPYRCDITSAIRPGHNQIEIQVANTWRNRIVGDLQPDCQHKITHIAFPGLVRADMPLLDAGLLGPVSIIRE